MGIWFWVSVATLVPFIAGFLYWQLIIAEGTYLGQDVVTWLYDIYANRYDTIKGFEPSLESYFLGQPIADHLSANSNPLVLDIGTGTARLPITLLAENSFSGYVVGVDHSRRMLEVAALKARSLIPERLLLLWRDGSDLPFPDSSFDVVTSLEMLEFTPNPAATLREAYRVLMTGGLLVTTRRTGPGARLLPGKVYEPEEFEQLLSEIGLESIKIMPWQIDYDLVSCIKPGLPDSTLRPVGSVIACRRCELTMLEFLSNASLKCKHCGESYHEHNGVIDYRL
jgi:ubiquinone/menaquinone biosynthesis C-methylase UbiE